MHTAHPYPRLSGLHSLAVVGHLGALLDVVGLAEQKALVRRLAADHSWRMRHALLLQVLHPLPSGASAPPVRCSCPLHALLLQLPRLARAFGRDGFAAQFGALVDARGETMAAHKLWATSAQVRPLYALGLAPSERERARAIATLCMPPAVWWCSPSRLCVLHGGSHPHSPLPPLPPNPLLIPTHAPLALPPKQARVREEWMAQMATLGAPAYFGAAWLSDHVVPASD